MKVAHLILNDAFTEIEQHLDELLASKLKDRHVLIYAMTQLLIILMRIF